MGCYRAMFLASLTASLLAGVTPVALASGQVRPGSRTATVAQADPNAPAPQPSSGDQGTAEPGATDPGSSDPNAGDPGATDPTPTGATPNPLPPSLPGATPSPIAPIPGHPKPTRARKHAILATPIRSGHTVPGAVAELLPSGRAAAPADAPYAVKLIIWTANRLIGLPYRYGGGHGSFADNSYDCSGAVSYALHAADAIAYPEDSTLLEKWGLRGAGKWVTVYANHGHAWMVVAGLRLDTSPFDDPSGLDGPRWRPASRPQAGYRVRHPLGL
jgi:cell wall-associated NlpC family hydrolase